jgi:phosphopantothenoylcysteine decarboxylase / phosphopantothenate---cysteine ligase
MKKKWRIGLGVCGGIAAYKAVEVLRQLQKANCEVQVAMTKEATQFVQPLTFRALTNKYVFVDDYAPDNPDPIAHVNFSKNVDLLLIVPATANILAKFANGIADDFLTSTYLASTAPVVVAPAMNTAMWNHPATQRNVQMLKEDGVYFIEPISGELACKTIGTGKLEEVENIVKQVLEFLESNKSSKTSAIVNVAENAELKGEHFLITTGSTLEEIDPIRYISNYSSGKMGFAIATAAQKRGAKVTVIAGNLSISPPENLEIVSVKSAEEMYQAVMNRINKATVYVGAAAVADYKPVNRSQSKIKKDSPRLIVEFEKTKDILEEVSKNRHQRLLVVGFAAETENLENYATEKMRKKNLDMIVANDVSSSSSGFGSDNNQGFILTRKGVKIEIPLMPKAMMAEKIVDEIAELLKTSRNRAKSQNTSFKIDDKSEENPGVKNKA